MPENDDDAARAGVDGDATATELLDDLHALVAAGDLGDDRRRAVEGFERRLDAHLRDQGRRLARFEALFEEAPDPYVTTDRAGTVLEANRAARALLGPRLTSRRPLSAFVVDADRERFDAWLAQLRAGSAEVRFETYMDTHLDVAGSSRLPVEVRLADDLSDVGYRWVLREQQRRHATEDQLRSVAEREQAESASLRAESQVKTDFLLSLSHDLRAPIAALLHQAELISRPDIDEDIRRRSAGVVEANATVLTEMLEAMVDIERFAIDGTQLDRSVVPAATLADLAGDERVDVTHVTPLDSHEVAVDLFAMRRAIRSALRRVRHQADVEVVNVDVSLSDPNTHVTLTLGSPDHDGPATATGADQDRSVDTRLMTLLVERHGGRVRALGIGAGYRVEISVPLHRPD